VNGAEGGPASWLDAERDAIGQRPSRALVGNEEQIVGLALSGGGIRSASVALGVLQGFHADRLLTRIDYLSTVSGGGYTGIGWLSWLWKQKQAGSGSPATPGASDSLDPGFPYAGGPPLAQVRDRASYLLPPGLQQQFLVLAMILRKLGGHMWAVLTWLLLSGSAIALLAWIAADVIRWDPATLALSGCVLLPCLMVIVGFVTTLRESLKLHAEATRRDPAWSGWLDRTAAGVLAIALTILVLCVQPWLLSMARVHVWGESPDFGFLAKLGGALTAVYTAAAALGVATRIKRYWFEIATTVGAALVLLVLYAVALGIALVILQFGATQGYALPPPRPLEAIGAAAGVGFLMFGLGLLINPNTTSMHSYYRHQLWKTFIGERQGGTPPKLSELTPRATNGPFLVVNAAVNGVMDRGQARRGRAVMPFTMTPTSIHIRTTSSAAASASATQDANAVPTATMEQADRFFDAASAMAMSAAAIGGNQSTQGSAARLLRGLLNLRTARWMFSPSWAARLANNQGPRILRNRRRYIAPWATLAELAGVRRVTPETRYILVSDGGHYENLGLTALLHRRCDVIIVVDAEADPEMQFNGLAVATRLARLDVVDEGTGEGTELNIDPAGFGWQADTKRVARHVVTGTARYPAAWGGGEARILYIKASVSGDESADILEYRSRYDDFPQETTADQFFSEEQFESYRALGEHIGRQAARDPDLRRWLGLPPPP
jgi:hypothetical protein